MLIMDAIKQWLWFNKETISAVDRIFMVRFIAILSVHFTLKPRVIKTVNKNVNNWSNIRFSTQFIFKLRYGWAESNGSKKKKIASA